MCIAIYKPKGQKVPNYSTFKTCFEHNDDGAGFMFAYNGKVHYQKGFMTFKAFEKGLKDALKQYGGKTQGADLTMLFHFRITSQGGVVPELTHPFPICNSYGIMKKTSGTCDMALVHNGIIDVTSSLYVKDHNDTMEFIKEIIYPLVKHNRKYYESEDIINVFDYLLGSNRVAILDGNGHVQMFGSWIEDNGIFYSNTSYKPYEYKQTKLFDKPYSYGYDYGYGYDDDYYDFPYGNKDTKKLDKNAVYHELSDKQISDIYALGNAYCDCGVPMVLNYDEDIDMYVLCCVECGKMYMVDDDLASFMISQDIGYSY